MEELGEKSHLETKASARIRERRVLEPSGRV